MSVHSQRKRITVPEIQSRKGPGSIVALTAYTKPMAKIIDPHVDLIIVGDSMGMVAYGMDSTLEVTLDMMIYHGRAVARGAEKACVVVDMPYASYQESPQQAYRNAAKVMATTGAQAIKMEGGPELAETVAFLTQRGIPVMPHIGLTPQHLNQLGGFKAQGKTDTAAQTLLETAHTLADAGGFALLLEGIYEQAARTITESVPIPTIGIGASPACDGQVLVTEDITGLFSDYTPKFVKRYAKLDEEIGRAVSQYANEVRANDFPTAEYCFGAN